MSGPAGHADGADAARAAGRRRAWRRTAAGGFAVAAAAMVATPLVPKGGRARQVLANVTVTGLATATFATVAERRGPARAAATLATVSGIGLAAEHIGTTTGVPFGRYSYTGALRPSVGPSQVPAVVPLAWFAMGVPSLAVGRGRVVASALALTAWDVFLDPQMTGEGYWRWRRSGRYRGIPLSNYVGWFAVGCVVAAAARLVMGPPPAGASHDGRRDGDSATATSEEGVLVGLYGFMAVMSTLGFAAFFGDPLVAAAGGAAMGGSLAWWWRGRRHG